MSEGKVSIKIEGMSCNKCSNRVKKALESTEGVRSAEVDLSSAQATVYYQEEKLTPEDLKRAILSAGYKTI